MREFDLDSYDFEELLSASPCTREEARDQSPAGICRQAPQDVLRDHVGKA
jgi:hypothetical protein